MTGQEEKKSWPWLPVDYPLDPPWMVAAIDEQEQSLLKSVNVPDHGKGPWYVYCPECGYCNTYPYVIGYRPTVRCLECSKPFNIIFSKPPPRDPDDLENIEDEIWKIAGIPELNEDYHEEHDNIDKWDV